MYTVPLDEFETIYDHCSELPLHTIAIPLQNIDIAVLALAITKAKKTKANEMPPVLVTLLTVMSGDLEVLFCTSLLDRVILY